MTSKQPSTLETAALKFAKAKADMEAYANGCAAEGLTVDRQKMLGLVATWRGAQMDLIDEARKLEQQCAGEAA